MFSEVCEREVNEVGGRPREDHLAAVARGRDPRGEVDVVTHIALVGHERHARVQTNAHLDLTRGKGFGERPCGGEGAGCGREGEEEGVPLRVDLDSAFGSAGFADQPAVLRESLGVGIGAKLPEKLRRSLNVGEEEGDGARRKFVSHVP